MNKKKSILESNLLYTLIAIVAGFIIGAVFLMIAGISPAVAYGCYPYSPVPFGGSGSRSALVLSGRTFKGKAGHSRGFVVYHV